MPFEDIQQETDALGGLASMPQQGGAPTAPMEGGGQQLGGPGVDTPQEQKAVQLLIQAATAMREAATVDPSIRGIIDKVLPDAFLQISSHYGFGEEGKLALKQANMQRDRAQAAKLGGGGGPMQGPPVGPPVGPQAGSQDITY